MPKQHFSTLSEWLNHLEQAHSKKIDLSLERITTVKNRLMASEHLLHDAILITVGGTNGKGSTCAYLEHILMAAGYRVACHTSPHILSFNERARMNGVQADTEGLLLAFGIVEQARCLSDEISLSYFEFTLLAFMVWFCTQRPDVIVLEVGLGGRLDATNVFDTDCAVITSIGIDHVQYLGDTREMIAYEKAGIFRKDRPAIIAEPDLPMSMLQFAEQQGAQVKRIGVDFNFQIVQEGAQSQWRYIGMNQNRNGLAMPAMRGVYQLGNASAALAALEMLSDRLMITQQAVRFGLSNAVVAGRFQVLAGQPVTVLDVAHNPHAAEVLAKNIFQMGYAPFTHAVFGAMADKDIASVLQVMSPHIDYWHFSNLPVERAASAQFLRTKLLDTGWAADQVHQAFEYQHVADAIEAAQLMMSLEDRLIIFGSFFTIEQALLHFNSKLS